MGPNDADHPLQQIDFFSDSDFSRIVRGFTRTPYVLPGFPLTVLLELSKETAVSDIDLPRCSLTFKQNGFESRHGFKRLDEPERGPILAQTVFLPEPGHYDWRIELSVDGHAFAHVGRQEVKTKGTDLWESGPLVLPIERGIYLGNVAAAARPEFLAAHDITVVLNAAEERDLRPIYHGHAMRYRHIPFKDFSHNPMAPERVWDAVRWLYEPLHAGRRALVHCHAGIGRSSSLIVSYLYLLEWPDRDFDAVVDHVRNAATIARHYIAPHKDLADSLVRLREKHRTDIARLTGHPVRLAPEPLGKVLGVSFAGGAQLGDTLRVRPGATLAIAAEVRYQGKEPPRGVFAWTNLALEKGEGVLLRRDPSSGLYKGEVTPRRPGRFWLTLCATPYRNNHFAERVWAGGDVFLDVR
jgi:hypothetical protein